ncbi:MAG: asparagine synthase-related protein, partial [Hyphomicrobiaceae bacterium]
MSGLLALLRLDGAPVGDDALARMAATLVQRGPEATRLWHDGRAGLGHTLLATTPEAAREPMPFRHAATGCVITADARLDNRDELLPLLGLADRKDTCGDGEVLLEAYLKWGPPGLARLLGDFAFVLWDPRRQALIAARDVFGMRPLCWHRSDRLLAIASEPKAILALPEVPREIDIGRTADFLIPELEGIDKTSTFWCGIERLPPAHVLVADARGTRIERYWSPEEVAELKLASSADYDEAFLDLLAQSIRARLRSVGPVAAMLSGGMDSGSIVAVASKLLREADQPPLVTFSAVGPDPATCTETRLARATAAHCGTDAHFINYDDLGDLMPELAHAMAASSEPFDYNMSLPCSVFMSAKRKGHKVVLSGAAGDNVLDAGLYVPRLLLSGRWRQLVRVGAGLVRFWGAGPARSLLLDQLSPALVPPPVFRRLRAWQFHRWTRSAIARGAITAERARLAHLPERYRTLHARFPIGVRHPYALERWQWIDLPYLVIGLERYDRVAGAQGIELREPFLDRR